MGKLLDLVGISLPKKNFGLRLPPFRRAYLDQNIPTPFWNFEAKTYRYPPKRKLFWRFVRDIPPSSAKNLSPSKKFSKNNPPLEIFKISPPPWESGACPRMYGFVIHKQLVLIPLKEQGLILDKLESSGMNFWHRKIQELGLFLKFANSWYMVLSSTNNWYLYLWKNKG